MKLTPKKPLDFGEYALMEVISVTPGISPKCRSRGEAMEVAIVSGSAPGRPAKTTMVGMSTLGSGATGR